MKRVLAVCLAVGLTVLTGCKDLAEEIVDEAGEVVRDQKHKVIEGAQDAAIEAADAQRESAVDKLTGGDEEEAGTDDGGDSSL